MPQQSAEQTSHNMATPSDTPNFAAWPEIIKYLHTLLDAPKNVHAADSSCHRSYIARNEHESESPTDVTKEGWHYKERWANGGHPSKGIKQIVAEFDVCEVVADMVKAMLKEYREPMPGDKSGRSLGQAKAGGRYLEEQLMSLLATCDLKSNKDWLL